MAFLPPAAPKIVLGRHRLLAPSASVRVSPLCLGGMSIGNGWSWGMGECTKASAFELLDTFYDLEVSRRSETVIATKYAMSFKNGHAVQQSNYGGTGAKSLHVSIQNSLKALNTDYVDILYVHCWDYATKIPELMHSLNSLINQGKVLYPGISDSPTWVLTKANMYGRYSAQERDLEREVIPMCQAEGMAFQPFGVMGGGYFKPLGKEYTGARNIPSPLLVGREEQMSKVLDAVATRHNVPITSVALAYAPHVFPVLGGHQDINILALVGHFDYVAPAKAIKPHKGDLTAPWQAPA
ncbi:aryl-alcohol dehydrogenase [Xylaria acuta]|nr:aryl-alcohol dehydrogenase [Xylaria acuta]